METFFKGIGEKIKEAVRNEFPKIKEKIGKEKPYSAAFVTDSDCAMLSLTVNTYEFLEKKDSEYSEKGYNKTSKWLPGEWGYSTDCSGELVKIANELSEKVGSIYEIVYNIEADSTDDRGQKLIEEYELSFLETVTFAFQELIQSDVFGFNPDEVTYFITISDDIRAKEIENNSAKVLNSKKVYEEFLNCFCGHGVLLTSQVTLEEYMLKGGILKVLNVDNPNDLTDKYPPLWVDSFKKSKTYNYMTNCGFIEVGVAKNDFLYQQIEFYDTKGIRYDHLFDFKYDLDEMPLKESEVLRMLDQLGLTYKFIERTSDEDDSIYRLSNGLGIWFHLDILASISFGFTEIDFNK